MKELNTRFKPSILFISLSSIIYANAFAQETATQLDAIDVTGIQEVKEVGTNKLKRKQLDKQMVEDVYDMVRYEPGISVVEGGRSGSNGFAIRGVDKDRVAISIDGLTQAESRSSEGFQELFGGYGNFNTNRNAAELENISEVNILKGANSITAGSGALGGAVLYNTKSPADYLVDGKDYYVGLKGGYTSKNSQRMGSLTLAGKIGALDGLVVYTSRSGHELKNHSNSGEEHFYKVPKSVNEGILREKPDPQDVSSKSGLIKLGYHFNADNYLNAVYEDYRQDKKTEELSNIWGFGGGGDKRYRNDVSYRKRIGFEYENILESGPWDRMRINVDRQRIEMTTLTWDIPKDIKRNGRNAQVYTSRRGLYQDLDQAKFAAEKYLEFDNNFYWDIFYGAGADKNTNSNDSLTYFSYFYNPSQLTSRGSTTEMLIEAQSKHFNLYWNNTFNWQDKYKVTAGIRYDKYKMKTIPDENFIEQLGGLGLDDARGSFGSLSYSLGFDWNITPSLTLLSKYSTGFRAPTTDEMWFNFNHPDFTVRYNPDLKAERAQNFELGLDWHGDWGKLRVSGFHTRYKDFIDFVYIGEQLIPYWDYATKQWTTSPYGRSKGPTYQNVNRESATVQGVELQSHWELGSVGLPQGLYTDLSASYNRGKTDDGTPMDAIQPFNGVLGLGYNDPADRWGIGANVSYFAKKKAKDTTLSAEQPDKPWPYADHSRSVWLLDLTGHYNIGKNVSIRAGVFNVFNQHYYTWNSLRSIRQFGAVNRVGSDAANTGIERFSAPGRNFGLTFEAKF